MINNFLFPSLSNSKLSFIVFFSGLFVGILIRVSMIFFIDFNFTDGDTSTYIETARNIIEFGIYGKEQEATVYRPPIYSFFIASNSYFRWKCENLRCSTPGLQLLALRP